VGASVRPVCLAIRTLAHTVVGVPVLHGALLRMTTKMQQHVRSLQLQLRPQTAHNFTHRDEANWRRTMITLRPANERGHAQHGWLESWHSFSFAEYHDPAHMHWGPLRVINEDRVQAGQGFGTHGHRDMEIISYVIAGALAHKDSMGNGAAIVPGEIQRMSAGTGVTHSEYNHNRAGLTHFLQIWIIPAQQGLPPSYQQHAFADSEKRGKLRLVGSPDGSDGSVTIHQDVRLYAGLFDGAERAGLALSDGRLAYLHVVQGSALVNGHRVGAGDALLYRDEAVVQIEQGDGAEVLVFDLPR
jgi:redox-sensitive bicupin YhaK (pirin superfamily)